VRVFTGGCHCGRVRFEITADLVRVVDCDCSICTAEGVHASHRAARTLPPARRCGCPVAQRHFCRTCGVASFYVPRSHPDRIDLNVRCLDGVDVEQLVVTRFDGRNWDASIGTLDV